LSKAGIPVEISNCAFFTDGFVPGMIGNFDLVFAALEAI